MIKVIMVFSVITVFLAGCSSSDRQQSAEKYQGREETKKLEGASAAGYDGTAVRKSVDNTLNKNDDHNRDLNGSLKSDSEEKAKE